MPNNIVYHAAGNIDRINECRYSLLKYLSVYNLKPPADTSFFIYTNKPESFEAFAPFFKNFQLKETNSALVPKFEFIQHALPSIEGNILFADCDTYFISSSENLFQEIQNGKILFYDQVLVSDNSSQMQKVNEHLANNGVKVDDAILAPSLSKNFYTTEVIGINKTALPLIKKMSDLHSQIHTSAPAPFTEQFAFTYFTFNEPALSANDAIISYRSFPQFKSLLQLFFKKNEEESIPNLVKLVHHLDAQAILHEKKLYDSQPFVKKLFSLLSGKAWSVRQYQNKF